MVPSFSAKKGYIMTNLLDAFKFCMIFGLCLILLGIVLAGFFSTLSSIIGLTGCFLSLGGMLGMLVHLVITSIREKKGF